MFLLNFLFFLSSSFAFLSLGTTGEILEENQYSLGGSAQFVFDGNDGINASGDFAARLSQDAEILVDAGFGATDLFFSGAVKYVPYPNTDKQPAIGWVFSAIYANEDNDSFMLLGIKGFISEDFSLFSGNHIITPYIGLSFNYTLTNDDNPDHPAHFLLGSAYKHESWQHDMVFAELGTDISDAFSFLLFKYVHTFRKD